MQYVELIAIISILQFLIFGYLTGLERRRSGLKAPAIAGDEGFERMYRVQMNTLELLIAFLPLLFIAGQYWSPIFIASIGAIYIIGRIIYWRAYTKEPSQRSVGFLLSLIPTIILMILATVGIVLSF